MGTAEVFGMDAEVFWRARMAAIDRAVVEPGAGSEGGRFTTRRDDLPPKVVPFPPETAVPQSTPPPESEHRLKIHQVCRPAQPLGSS